MRKVANLPETVVGFHVSPLDGLVLDVEAVLRIECRTSFKVGQVLPRSCLRHSRRLPVSAWADGGVRNGCSAAPSTRECFRHYRGHHYSRGKGQHADRTDCALESQQISDGPGQEGPDRVPTVAPQSIDTDG